jgi:hypothetical protein
MGFSRVEHKVYGSLWDGRNKLEVVFEDVSHYITKNFYLFLGADTFYRPFAGQIA